MQNLLFSYSSIPLWIPLSSSLPPLLPITTSELHSKKVLLIPMILATISTKSSIRMKPLKKSLLKITVWYSFSIMRNNLQMHSSDPPLIKKEVKVRFKICLSKNSTTYQLHWLFVSTALGFLQCGTSSFCFFFYIFILLCWLSW